MAKEVTPPPVEYVDHAARDMIKTLGKMLLNVQKAQKADHNLILLLHDRIKSLESGNVDTAKALSQTVDQMSVLSNLMRKHKPL